MARAFRARRHGSDKASAIRSQLVPRLAALAGLSYTVHRMRPLTAWLERTT
jgi:hypothetical protein